MPFLWSWSWVIVAHDIFDVFKNLVILAHIVTKVSLVIVTHEKSDRPHLCDFSIYFQTTLNNFWLKTKSSGKLLNLSHFCFSETSLKRIFSQSHFFCCSRLKRCTSLSNLKGNLFLFSTCLLFFIAALS